MKTIIDRHVELNNGSSRVETVPICDIEGDNYLLMAIGWNSSGRVHSIGFHLRIRNGKIWIEWDGTEEGVALESIDLGVDKQDIVLGFYRQERRVLTEFASA
ncbi:MAG: XisI protein [Microcoleus sp. SM1_3_4]|nr:XisI protein [Microcoleus sp. SM1_3_4]